MAAGVGLLRPDGTWCDLAELRGGSATVVYALRAFG
jgi:hypothetical protein